MTDLLVAPEATPEEAIGADVRPGAAAAFPPRRRFRRLRRMLRSRVVRMVLGVALLAALVVGRSVALTLTAPGTDSTAERLSIWARDHRLGSLVNLGERLTYKPPNVGGQPAEAIRTAATGVTEPAAMAPAGPPPPAPAGPPTPSPAGPPTPAPAGPPPPGAPTAPKGPVPLPAPDPIVAVAGTPIPDEGAWQTLKAANGAPLVRAAFLRADPVYTSYLAAVAWMDTRLLGFSLQPGTSDPGGGPWPAGASLPVGERGDVVAAFNSAFRMVDSRGGFYLGGTTQGTMRDGAATIVFSKDGSVQVGSWNADVTMTSDVLGARQNLDLIVDEGQVNPRINDNSGNRWGATLGNNLYVWRSGVGVTANGALLYAAGPRLSAESLAQLLVRAGAVRAMELDINPSWTIFVHYANTPDGSMPKKLLPGMQRPATTYDTPNSRDFIVARLR